MGRRVILEEHGDRRLDPVVAQMARHHMGCQDDFDDLIRFMANPFETEQLDILLKRMGPRVPLQTERFGLERKDGFTTLRCFAHLSRDVIWTMGRILVMGNELPETVRTVLIGEPLSRLVEHPYLPDYLLIDGISVDPQQRQEFHLRRAKPDGREDAC